MEKKLIQIQIALFFTRNLEQPIEKVSLLIQEKLGNPKNKTFPPTFPQLPPEIPRLVLIYDKFKINFSLNRMDLFLNNYDEKIISIVRDKILPVVIEDLGIKIGRIGFVKNFFIEKRVEELKQLFNEDITKKLDGVKEISVRVNVPRNILEHECNNIEIFRKGRIMGKNPQGKERVKNGLIVQRDINTFKEKLIENSFNSKQILEIIEKFNEETETFVLISN